MSMPTNEEKGEIKGSSSIGGDTWALFYRELHGDSHNR